MRLFSLLLLGAAATDSMGSDKSLLAPRVSTSDAPVRREEILKAIDLVVSDTMNLLRQQALQDGDPIVDKANQKRTINQIDEIVYEFVEDFRYYALEEARASSSRATIRATIAKAADEFYDENALDTVRQLVEAARGIDPLPHWAAMSAATGLLSFLRRAENSVWKVSRPRSFRRMFECIR